MSHFVKSVENSGTLFNTNDEDNDDINNDGKLCGVQNVSDNDPNTLNVPSFLIK